ARSRPGRPCRAACGCASRTSGPRRTRVPCAGGAPAPRRGPGPSVGQPEHALGDDVELDLRGAALDRVAARAEPVARHLELLVRKARALPAERLRPQDLHHQRAPALVQLRPVELEDRRLGAGLVAGLGAVARARQRQIETGLVHLELRDAVAGARIGDAAALLAEVAAGARHHAPWALP